MIKCKQAENAECGKVCCCLVCEEKEGCTIICESVKDHDITDPTECEEADGEETELDVMNSAVPDVLKAITDITVQKKKLEEQEKLMKKKLQEAMEQHGVKSFENADVKFVYVEPTTRTTIDSTKLKKELPDIAEKYSKTSPVSASVRITVK
jgi:hypothetical protein